MSSEEIRLAQTWYDQEALAPSQIAQRLGRDKSVITHLLVKQVPRKKQGRRQLLFEPRVDLLLRRLRQMIVSADAKHHVTVQMLHKAAKTKASERIIDKTSELASPSPSRQAVQGQSCIMVE